VNAKESFLYYQPKETLGAVSVSEALAAAAENGSLTTMPRLWRSPKDLQHWFVFDDSTGWVTFPARVNGWASRRPVRTIRGLDLKEVPLWLSFGTGLLDAPRTQKWQRAA
jgi:hypothetical protein